MKNFSKINKKINKQKGFTLLETLISIFILTLAITGPIYISSFALRNTIDSRDNISAQYLAEEVIEVMRNKRDQRILSNMSGNTKHWLGDNILESITGDDDCFNESNVSDDKCILTKDTDQEYVAEKCDNSVGCLPLFFSSSSDIIYGLSDENAVGDTSKFVREFYFQKGKNDASATDIPDKEVKLIVNIKWKDRGVDKIYTLTERLYNINYVNYFTK